MFREDYRKELDNLTVSDSFKTETIRLMKQKSAEKEITVPVNKTVKFAPKYSPIISAAAIALITVSLAAGAWFGSGLLSTGSDAATKESAPFEHISDDKTTDTDDYAAQSGIEYRTYTIADADTIPAASQREVKANTRNKVVFNISTSGGMGFEGLLYYDISQLNTKNCFDENVVYDTLPIYEFSSMDNDNIRNEFAEILAATDMTADDINSVKTEWVEFDEHNIISNTIATDTADKPSDDAKLYIVYVDMEDAFIRISPERSQVSVYLYDDRPEEEKLIGEYAAANYTQLLGDNLDSYVYGDYNIYGEQHFSPHYLFRTADDYAQYAFNNSAGSVAVWRSDSMWMSRNDKGENIHFQYTPDSAYTKAGELPAISWQQALGMLYNNQFSSTVYEEITEDTVISKIELVYKEPPYLAPSDHKSGYALPFYKFYVELPSYNRETEAGTLKNYGVYYVCAIHPDYVEFTDEYVTFN